MYYQKNSQAIVQVFPFYFFLIPEFVAVFYHKKAAPIVRFLVWQLRAVQRSIFFFTFLFTLPSSAYPADNP